MEDWNITKESKIFKYGAGSQGKKLLDSLQTAGFVVTALIDKRYEDLQAYYSIPVISPNDINIFSETNKTVLLFTLNNGMLHERIALDYINKGISKVVFLPMGELLSIEDRHKMRYLYHEIIFANNYNVSIPVVSCKHNNGKRKNIIINSSYSDAISFYLDINSLYISKRYYKDPLSLYGNKKNERMDFLAGKKAVSFDEYNILFSHLHSGDATIDNTKEYLVFSGRLEKSEQMSLLEDRKKLYSFFDEICINDPSFFLDSPIQCSIEDGKPCIIDGYHRFFYLKEIGHKKVPVIMKKEDYHHLFN